MNITGVTLIEPQNVLIISEWSLHRRFLIKLFKDNNNRLIMDAYYQHPYIVSSNVDNIVIWFCENYKQTYNNYRRYYVNRTISSFKQEAAADWQLLKIINRKQFDIKANDNYKLIVVRVE